MSVCLCVHISIGIGELLNILKKAKQQIINYWFRKDRLEKHIVKLYTSLDKNVENYLAYLIFIFNNNNLSLIKM